MVHFYKEMFYTLGTHETTCRVHPLHKFEPFGIAREVEGEHFLHKETHEEQIQGPGSRGQDLRTGTVSNKPTEAMIVSMRDFVSKIFNGSQRYI